MSPDLAYVLDECIELTRNGLSVEECLARYPEVADELKPVLEMAVVLQSVEVPASAPEAIRQSRERMFAAVDKKFSSQAVSISPFARYTVQLVKWITGKENIDMKLVTRLAYTLMFVVFLVGAAGTAIASAKTIPGDTLYPVKALVEQVQYTLTLNPEARHELRQETRERHLTEVQEAIREGRIVDVAFAGELRSKDQNVWDVSGVTVVLDDNTVVKGSPEVGMIVEVRGSIQEDGSVLALVIAVNVWENGNPYPGPADAPYRYHQEHEQYHDGTVTPFGEMKENHERNHESERKHWEGEAGEHYDNAATMAPAGKPDHPFRNGEKHENEGKNRKHNPAQIGTGMMKDGMKMTDTPWHHSEQGEKHDGKGKHHGGDD